MNIEYVVSPVFFRAAEILVHGQVTIIFVVTCIFRGLGAQKAISSYSFDRIVLIFGYIVQRTNTKILSSHFLHSPS